MARVMFISIEEPATAFPDMTQPDKHGDAASPAAILYRI
jgi:hypothetical protein